MSDQLPQKAGQKRPSLANDHELDDRVTPKKQKVPDLEDGQVTVVPIRELHDYPKPDETESFAIESINGSDGGNLLQADDYGNSRKLNVYFKGSDFNDPTTVFQIGRNDEKEANYLSYRKDDEKFYLAVRKCSEVLLRKLVNPPPDDKYFFCIERVNPDDKFDSPVTFRSLKSGEYLHCSDTGRVFMKDVIIKKGNQHPEDRQTWFKLLSRGQFISFQEEKVLFAREETCVESTILNVEFIAAEDDSKDAGKGGMMNEFTDPGKTNSKEPDKKTSEAPVVVPLRKPGEENSENPEKTENSEKSVVALKDIEKNNPEEQVMPAPQNPKEKNSICSEKISQCGIKERSFDDPGGRHC